jgi:hypothetical protein
MATRGNLNQHEISQKTRVQSIIQTFSEWQPEVWYNALAERHTTADSKKMKKTAESFQVATKAKGLM